jgi:ubiquinone/menaquinone biosynthesis C-methylase UbiE
MQHFAECGARVFGVDTCQEMLDQARRKPLLCGRLAQADAAAVPIATGAAGLTLCSFAAGYIADLGRALREMARVTRSGGRVIVSDLHPSALAAGWTRSFRDGGTVIEIAHHQRPEAELLAAARDAGLSLDRTIAASFGEPERAIFRAAGKPMPQLPAIWIGIWNRP